MGETLHSKSVPAREKVFPWSSVSAYEQYYKEHFVKMVIFCEGMLGDKDLAAQLVQESFLKIWERRHQLGTVSNPSAYLFQTVRNTALDYIDKFRRELRVEQYHEEIEEDTSPELSVAEELVPYVKQAASKLPEKCRIIFEMSFLKGISKEEIAAYLEISPLTVKKQRAIALKKIRRELLPLLNKLLFLVWLLE